MKERSTFEATFDDGGRMLLNGAQLAQFSHDAESWFGFLGMLAGGSAARMRAFPERLPVQNFTVNRRDETA